MSDGLIEFSLRKEFPCSVCGKLTNGYFPTFECACCSEACAIRLGLEYDLSMCIGETNRACSIIKDLLKYDCVFDGEEAGSDNPAHIRAIKFLASHKELEITGSSGNTIYARVPGVEIHEDN